MPRVKRLARNIEDSLGLESGDVDIVGMFADNRDAIREHARAQDLDATLDANPGHQAPEFRERDLVWRWDAARANSKTKKLRPQ